ncbi:DUF659 domain-containing protein [Artemisia annua]|uniref:DUF659 domain-containing protein n=1 Tax=Artemisia annua TaxID=35608 RepID=A0A2U1LMV2_ARTAN|nr:DUF659 domain-containing protein [Artemisia annua]
MVEIGEIETGKGANQIGTIKRAGDTRWSSHLNSISSLLRMYNPTCTVLENIKRNGSNYKTKGDAIVELLQLTAALDPRDGYKSFNVDSICKLARKYYFLDFTEQDIDGLEFQLKHFEVDVKNHSLLQKSSSIAKLCQDLAQSGKAKCYDNSTKLDKNCEVGTILRQRSLAEMGHIKYMLTSLQVYRYYSDDF